MNIQSLTFFCFDVRISGIREHVKRNEVIFGIKRGTQIPKSTWFFRLLTQGSNVFANKSKFINFVVS